MSGWRAAVLAVVVAVPRMPSADPAAGASDEAYAEYEAELGRWVAPPPAQDAAGKGVLTPGTGEAPTCLLFGRDAARVESRQCMECHGTATHPVDLDYAAAQQQQPSSLRPVAEAIQRGVFLPDGQLRCVTCHDARSPWMYRVALPAGAEARPAVDPRAPATYRTSGPGAAHIQPLPGAAVTPTPLCKSCHSIGD